ncbi:hypothetical protein [Streptomyces sp. NPDC002265]|uniref:hypothetical protein n=1 Tax=Streptomyces sp. NPDC002265 TaxID=3154415 RepID=UPI0033222ED6
MIDKTAVLARSTELTPHAVYPMEIAVACLILSGAEEPTGDELVTVSLAPDGVTTSDGRDTFTVDSSQLIR